MKGLALVAEKRVATSLLGAALLGVLASLVAPRRFGRRGGLAVLGGVAVVLARDATMVLTGVPGRLKLLPRLLLLLELAAAAAPNVDARDASQPGPRGDVHCADEYGRDPVGGIPIGWQHRDPDQQHDLPLIQVWFLCFEGG
jgi:hypothetical protein